MSFSQFGLKRFLEEKIKELDFKTPTPVQQKAIPLLKKHRNLIVEAPTGTGKTHAFLFPLINNLDPTRLQEIQLIIVVPTQELGQQLWQNVRFLIEKTQFKVELHTKAKNQENLTSHEPTIIIGTPQRLAYLYSSQKRILTKACALVVDEADMILAQGFIEDLDLIISKMNSALQISFFSATINQELKNYLKKYVKNSFWLEVKPPSQKLVKNFLIEFNGSSYGPTLEILIRQLNPFLALIFVKDKSQIRDIRAQLEALKLGPVGAIHGDLEPRVRNQIFKRINQGFFKYVIATDLASRGLDIAGVSHVISLGLPKNLDFYLHRSGRTGRNQSLGVSYLLVSQNEDQNRWEKLKKRGIDFTSLKFNPRTHSFEEKRTNFSSTKKSRELQLELKRLTASFDKQPVKPNYKKKQKQAREKLFKQHRRQEIIRSMRQNKKKRYKKRRNELFNK